MTTVSLVAAEVELRRRLSYNLAHHMRRMGHTQASLAKLIAPGRDRHDIAHMQTGTWSTPGLVVAVCLAMGLDVGALYQPTEAP